MNRPLQSALKAHCKPGPRSPSRCTSSTTAAIPPTFLPYDNAVAFHKSLKPRELANPQFRAAVGELASALFNKDKKAGLRSIATLENLCGLSQNESAVSCLRELAKSFGSESTDALSISLPRISRGSSRANPISVSSAVHAQSQPKSSSVCSTRAGESSCQPSQAAPMEEDDTVRFSTSVQSKLFHSSESPRAISAGGQVQRGHRRGGGDKSGQGSSGGSSRKRSRVQKSGVPKSASRSAKHLSDRPGDVSSLSVEAPRPKDSASSAVPPVVQLQSHSKNMDKIQRKPKKSSSASKRASAVEKK
jgi:hypothetical protein